MKIGEFLRDHLKKHKFNIGDTVYFLNNTCVYEGVVGGMRFIPDNHYQWFYDVYTRDCLDREWDISYETRLEFLLHSTPESVIQETRRNLVKFHNHLPEK